MRRRAMLAAVVLVTAACGRGSAGQGGAADSTATPAPEGLADRTGAAAGSAAESSAARPTTAMSAGAAKAPRTSADSIIGYDSAFGPRFTVDSTGKIVPIVKKKP